jgi:hypothetical protein
MLLYLFIQLFCNHVYKSLAVIRTTADKQANISQIGCALAVSKIAEERNQSCWLRSVRNSASKVSNQSEPEGHPLR